MLTVTAVDPGGVRRGRLVPVGSPSAVWRDTDAGAFMIPVALDDLSSLISDGWEIVIADGGLTMRGIIESREVSVQDGGLVLTLSGKEGLVLLADRVTYPNPGVAVTAQTAEGYYTRKGTAGVLIRDLIDANAGPAARPERRAARIVCPAPIAQGGNTSVNTRYKPLLEVVRGVARAGGVRVWLEPSGADWAVRIARPRDRSREVRFQVDVDGSVAVQAPTVTNVVVAGQGQGAARTIREYTQASTWGRRIEVFQDRRDTDDVAEHDQAGAQTLAEGAAAGTASFPVTESDGARFGVDYNLGDMVSVRMGPVVISEPVRAVQVDWDGYGRTVKLTLGDHDQADDNAPAWVARTRDIEARLRRIEAV